LLRSEQVSEHRIMTLYSGQTFNEEVMLLNKIEKSQYSVRVISDEAHVFVINELEFRKLKYNQDTLQYLVLFMQSKARNLYK
jgi:predicted RNA-binding protein with PUA domain